MGILYEIQKIYALSGAYRGDKFRILLFIVHNGGGRVVQARLYGLRRYADTAEAFKLGLLQR